MVDNLVEVDQIDFARSWFSKRLPLVRLYSVSFSAEKAVVDERASILP
jgi:hypothetical protein